MSLGLKQWVLHFWRKLVCENECLEGSETVTKKSILSLPDDVILNILTRLPTQSVLQCKLVVSQWNCLSSTPYFAEAHLANNLTPQFLVEDRHTNTYGKELMVLLKGSGKHAWFDRVHLKCLQKLLWKGECCFQILCSCNGVIVFAFPYLSNDLYAIYNPITLERFLFREKFHHIFGFFFHELEGDYKMLLYEMDSEYTRCTYYLYGLKNKDKRILESSCYCPRYYTLTGAKHELATVVCGFVFWMVWSMPDFELPKQCFESIMMFDLKTERFNIMPHPGSTCTSFRNCKLHEKMRLLEVDGRLSLCHVLENTIEVWILHDVKNWMWEKMHVLKFDECFDHYCWGYAHMIVAIHNGNLLLNWPQRGLFWCNLASNHFWEAKVPFKYNRNKCSFYAIRYTSSFVSFGSGEISSCTTDFVNSVFYKGMKLN